VIVVLTSTSGCSESNYR